MNTQTRPIPRAARRARGMSLIELMVAISIGMVIVTAMSLLFANNSRSRSETERANQKIENGRYALEVMAGDLHHAGYFSVFDPRQLTAPADKPDACDTVVAGAAFQSAMALYVQGYDNVAATALSACLTGLKAGTDIVVTRRASGCVAGVGTCSALSAGAPAFQASSCNDAANPELATGVVDNYYKLSTNTATFTLTKRNCVTPAEVRRFLVRIYFVASNDKDGDGIPTLKRAELGPAGFTTTSLVQGVENLQVEYGLDTNGDGNADVYTASPDLYLGCTNATVPTCVGNWMSVVSAKVFILSRGIDPSPGHNDNTRTYVLGANVVGPFNDAYKRSVFQEVMRLQNASGRRFSPS
jgi:type IV pilus assembly protein PilW